MYSIASQVAGLLPSSIAPGAYSIGVALNGQSSAPQPVTVVARSFGIATVNSAGTGAAQVSAGNVNGGLSLVRLTSGQTSFNGYDWMLAPAHPNDMLVIWGTGGGSGNVEVAGVFQSAVSGSAGNPATWLLQTTTFVCRVPASAGSYTVPASVFSLLPSSSSDLTSGNQAFLAVHAAPARQQSSFRFRWWVAGRRIWAPFALRSA